MRRVYNGMLYTELSKNAFNAVVKCHAPSWWQYTTTITIPTLAWEACPIHGE